MEKKPTSFRNLKLVNPKIKYLSLGDEIMVEDELGFKKEVKIINMVLSNKSAGVSEPFEKDYITSVPFKYRKKPVVRNSLFP
jgi:hypothetical protein